MAKHTSKNLRCETSIFQILVCFLGGFLSPKFFQKTLTLYNCSFPKTFRIFKFWLQSTYFFNFLSFFARGKNCFTWWDLVTEKMIVSQRILRLFSTHVKFFQITNIFYPLIRKRAHVRVSSNTAGIYMLKVNNRNTRTRCEICSKLTINIPEPNCKAKQRPGFYMNCNTGLKWVKQLLPR